jgi:hypothetical protein
VVIEVRDRGPGIPPELVDRIFEPFFSSKKRSNSSGSGLGLSIVSAVIQDHKGVLDLVTGPEGTSFRIFIPYAHVNEDTVITFNSQHILLIGSDVGVVEHVFGILRSTSAIVVHASTAAEALTLAKTNTFGTAIVDMGNGRSLPAEPLRRLQRTQPHLSFIVLSQDVSAAPSGELDLVAGVIPRHPKRQELFSVLNRKSSRISRAA